MFCNAAILPGLATRATQQRNNFLCLCSVSTVCFVAFISCELDTNPARQIRKLLLKSHVTYDRSHGKWMLWPKPVLSLLSYLEPSKKHPESNTNKKNTGVAWVLSRMPVPPPRQQMVSGYHWIPCSSLFMHITTQMRPSGCECTERTPVALHWW